MIITLEEYKALKGVKDTSDDETVKVLIPLVEEEYLHIRGRALDAEDEWPQGAKLVAADMIEWRLKRQGTAGVSSESIGDYSVSWSDPEASYPSSIVKRIRRYLEVLD